MGAIRVKALTMGVAIGLIASMPVARGQEYPGVPEASLLVAAHSSVVPMSETGEWLNGAPAEIPAPADPASIRAPAISAALAENDVFINATRGGGDGLAMSRTALAALAAAEASAGESLSGGIFDTDNGIGGADVSGDGAMLASMPGTARNASAAASLAQFLLSLVEVLDGGRQPDMAPENAAPVSLAAHGGAINATEIE